MKHVVTHRDRLWVLVAAMSALCAAPAGLTSAAPQAAHGADRQVALASSDALRESVSLIQNGRFEAASSRLAPVAGSDPSSDGPIGSGLVAMKRAPCSIRRMALVISSKL